MPEDRRIENIESQLETIWKRIDELRESNDAVKTQLVELKALSSEQIRILKEISENGLRQCVICSADMMSAKNSIAELKAKTECIHEIKYAMKIIYWLSGIIGSSTAGLIIKALADMMQRH